MVDDVEEFVALCASILSDGAVTEEEAYQLGDWLNHHEEAAEHWPCDQLIEPLQAVWSDGSANPQELQRLGRVLVSLQEEWALRKAAMATYYKSLGPASQYSYVPNVRAPLAPVPPPPSIPHRSSAKASLPPPSRPKRRGWILATGSVTVLLIAAGFFAVREMKSAHHDPATASSSPVVRASPPLSTSLAPPRSGAAQTLAKPATPSAAWMVTTRQNVKAKVGKKEIIIPKGTTLKVIARTDRDLMISYKGEDLTIPASSTTSPR
jgi:hypothetical protein